MTYIYLCSPYSASTIKGRDSNYNATLRWVANHMRLYRSPVIFSPILHCHDLVTKHGFKGDAATWDYYNTTMLKGSVGVWVLKLPGWTTSKGIHGDAEKGLPGELTLAKQLNKEVKFIDVARAGA